VSAITTERIHITGLFPELLGVGGVQEAGRLTAVALDQIARSHNWSTNLFSLNDPMGEQKLQLDGASLSLEGFARGKARFVAAALRSRRAANKSGAHIIVAGHPHMAPVAAWMQRCSTARPVRAIVMAHGIEVWQPLPLLRGLGLRRVHTVTAPSNDTQRKLVDIQRIDAARTRRLPWPLNPDFLRLSERRDLPLPPGFPNGQVILTIGRAAASEKYKGTDGLIQAVAQMSSAIPDLHLVAVGGGDDLDRLKELATDLAVAERVRFLQGLSREQIAACYSKCDVFALPSAGEGFGLVFLEAMTFGKPVVAARSGGAVDMVEDGANGLLVPPRDPAALALALGRLLKDAALRQALGARGEALVREKYSFEHFRAELEILLKECAIGPAEAA